MNIVHHSFEGRYSDHPRALYEAMVGSGVTGHEHVWLVDPAHAAGFPGDVVRVPYGGPEAVAALEAADLVVSNTHMELDWHKADTTTYLQTWHGTPFKTLHHDALWAPPGRLDRLDEDIARWDVLLSPSPFATPIFRRAFRYGGEVLEVGSPRDDVLLGPGASARRAMVRARLGLPEGARAVLYAPTWRDDEVLLADGDRELELHLDPAVVVGELPDTHLLLRTHYMQTGWLPQLDVARVHDVSWLADINDLHLAADVLVSDYSSLMFDWAVTGKPIVLFPYDLERYRDRTRGFSADVLAEIPGPVVRSQTALVEALRGAATLPTGNHPRYAAFRRRYCPLEDGAASARVLERVLRPRAADGARPVLGPAHR